MRLLLRTDIGKKFEKYPTISILLRKQLCHNNPGNIREPRCPKERGVAVLHKLLNMSKEHCVTQPISGPVASVQRTESELNYTDRYFTCQDNPETASVHGNRVHKYLVTVLCTI